MVENVILGTISNGGHIEIQDGGHCGLPSCHLYQNGTNDHVQ
jgi:hypothetical protein